MPATEKQVSREWPQPREQVFATLVQVVQDGKYRLGARDDAAHHVFFEKGSKWAWIHHFEAQVVESDAGSRLELSVKSPPEAIIGLANGLILQKAGEKLLKLVDAALPGVART